MCGSLGVLLAESSDARDALAPAWAAAIRARRAAEHLGHFRATRLGPRRRVSRDTGRGASTTRRRRRAVAGPDRGDARRAASGPLARAGQELERHLEHDMAEKEWALLARARMTRLEQAWRDGVAESAAAARGAGECDGAVSDLREDLLRKTDALWSELRQTLSLLDQLVARGEAAEDQHDSVQAQILAELKRDGEEHQSFADHVEQHGDAAKYRRPSGNLARWSRLCHVLQEDHASSPTLQKLSGTVFVSPSYWPAPTSPVSRRERRSPFRRVSAAFRHPGVRSATAAASWIFRGDAARPRPGYFAGTRPRPRPW